MHIPVSPGEVLDKITILEIKSARIGDTAKLANIQTELMLLEKVWASTVRPDEVLSTLKKDLKKINETLWDIEDDIRDQERAKEFGAKFVELARQVYITNDRRSELKKAINQHLGSQIMEEKSYQDYN
jgi:hypothetical protein